MINKNHHEAREDCPCRRTLTLDRTEVRLTFAICQNPALCTTQIYSGHTEMIFQTYSRVTGFHRQLNLPHDQYPRMDLK